jgi:hypothetical protein
MDMATRTSGAIQNGVPTMLLRLRAFTPICPETLDTSDASLVFINSVRCKKCIAILPKITQFHLALGGGENVGCLDVAVDDVGSVVEVAQGQ